MADLIKKIKIKRQDGTYTNYIPIGVDAVNAITDDGESVQLKLNKKPYYFDTVKDMKNAKLKEGDYVITLGYYQINDGGGAEYKIIDGEYTDNGGSYHKLGNNLFAELILKDVTKPEIFGAKRDGQTDDSTAFQNAVNYCQENKNILQLMGRYLFYSI